MQFLLNFIFISGLFYNAAIAAPHESFSLDRRNVSLSSPNITTIVHSSNGTDVSSSFRTLLYYQSDPALRTSNLTDRQVLSVRRIDRCRAPGAQFLGSICTHSQGTEVSLWRYTIHCRINPIPMYDLFNPLNPTAGQPRFIAEHGSCEHHELCVNSMPHEVHGVPVATCVNTNNFMPTPRDQGDIPQDGQEGSKAQYVGDALREIGAKKAGIAVSNQETSEVIELDALEVDIGAQGSDINGKLQQQKCRDCYGMRTKPAPANADFMKIEATLLGTTVMTGIIWVTVFAG